MKYICALAGVDRCPFFEGYITHVQDLGVIGIDEDLSFLNLSDKDIYCRIKNPGYLSVIEPWVGFGVAYTSPGYSEYGWSSYGGVLRAEYNGQVVPLAKAAKLPDHILIRLPSLRRYIGYKSPDKPTLPFACKVVWLVEDKETPKEVVDSFGLDSEYVIYKNGFSGNEFDGGWWRLGVDVHDFAGKILRLRFKITNVDPYYTYLYGWVYKTNVYNRDYVYRGLNEIYYEFYISTENYPNILTPDEFVIEFPIYKDGCNIYFEGGNYNMKGEFIRFEIVEEWG